jgi:hypothetical protein
MSIGTCQIPADKFGFGLIEFGVGRFDDQKGTINKDKFDATNAFFQSNFWLKM